MKLSRTVSLLAIVIVTTGISAPLFIAGAQSMVPLQRIDLSQRTARSLPMNNAAWVVSEVTVKKVVDTKELARIREALQGVDPSSFRLETVTNGRRSMTGKLSLDSFVMVNKTATSLPRNRAASVVSEVTVKKVVDTKELQRIREILAAASADASVHALRLEELR